VLSALKRGLADFDNLNAAVDRKTLSPEDRKRVDELLAHRPVKFCMFLKALIGAEAMERMMVQAINVAKQVPGELAVFRALHFALGICNIPSPLFAKTFATMQNLPFSEQWPGA
jgi:hypothetical protein